MKPLLLNHSEYVQRTDPGQGRRAIYGGHFHLVPAGSTPAHNPFRINDEQRSLGLDYDVRALLHFTPLGRAAGGFRNQSPPALIRETSWL